MRPILTAWLETQGYTNIANRAAKLCGIRKMMFTYGLVINLDWNGYDGRYCFEHLEDAQKALAEWSGEGHPSGPWIKYKARGVDLLNPELTV